MDVERMKLNKLVTVHHCLTLWG